ncbi:hypothetical protein SFC88_19645 [Nocardioides sp. HM23]|uniref:hypothetical protein n=1 Tax=Nocardioides bizhenqiangii TaxID=3095076 RepID=UPI002ACA6611|nr:hypothetical protein [Nocardioides sp. HM23]MDZ5623062.1 hypothetical protein [Nocardioides sp. HM23]
MRNLWDYLTNVWDYRELTWTLDRDLLDYNVEATDGRVGTVVRAASGAFGAYLVVDKSEVFAQARIIPAGAVTSLDHERRRVDVSLTTRQVREAPEHDFGELDPDARAAYSNYYDNVLP